MQSETIPSGQAGPSAGWLARRLAADERLAAAWRRGRFLRDLRSLAATAMTVAEAAGALGMTAAELAGRLQEDREVRECWNEARLASLVSVKAALLAEAKKGRPAAARQFEELLRRDLARPAVDFRRLTTEQMVEITGRTRQTLHEWFSRHRMPRNSDKSYNLAEFLAWFERFVEGRFAGEPSARAIAAADPLKAVKAQNLQLELERKRGNLLQRDEVIGGLLARYQRLIGACQGKAQELALLCHGAEPAAIAATLRNFFAELRQGLLVVPEELKLPAAAAEKFAELIDILQQPAE